MDKNPFNIESQSEPQRDDAPKINVYAGFDTRPSGVSSDLKNLTLWQKVKLLIKTAFSSFLSQIAFIFKKISDPLLSKTTDTANFIVTQHKTLSNTENSEIYRLINLLGNKRPHVALKAAGVLEQKILNPEIRKIVMNYFKFNPDARTKYKKLYLLTLEKRSDSP